MHSYGAHETTGAEVAHFLFLRSPSALVCNRWSSCMFTLWTFLVQIVNRLLGREYMGTLSTTVNGRTCQAWASNTTHEPNSAAQNDANYPDGSRAAANNYCRNPDSDPVGPWCYTTDPDVRWEACNIPYCGTSNGYSTLSIDSSYVR